MEKYSRTVSNIAAVGVGIAMIGGTLYIAYAGVKLAASVVKSAAADIKALKCCRNCECNTRSISEDEVPEDIRRMAAGNASDEA